MILSDVEIKEYIQANKITISPEFHEKNIRPAGIRLHLADELLIPEKNQVVDLMENTEVRYNKQTIPKEGFMLKPGMFILASTLEQIKVPRNIVGKLDGRSTVARLGMQIHCSSDIMDGNHDEPRTIVLEIKNIGVFDIILRSKAPVGMLVFHKLSKPIEQKSQSQYRNQTGVQGANLGKQFE